MKKLLISICTIAAFHSVYAQNLDRSIKPKAGPAPQINIADAQTFTLDNGLKVYVVESHKLPTVTYSLQLDIDVPNNAEKAGLDQFIGSMMTSGTKTRSKQQFLDEKDAIGASIGASSTGVYGLSLVKHQDKMLQLLSDILLNPNFSNEELVKLKKQAQSGLKMSETNAESIMDNVSRIVNYGPTHPYSEITTPESLKNINLSDISKYHRTYFKPNVAYLAVVGDVKVEEVKKLVQKYFGSWAKGDVPKATYPAVPVVTSTQVHFANKPGAVQSEIAISNTVQLKHKDPDFNSAKIMNYILGGGSSSKLFLNLREDKAWTYGSYSSLNHDKEVGNIKLVAKARNEVTDSSITEMLKEMNIMRNQTIDPSVLQGAKNYMNGVFALGLREPQTLASYAINIDKYNLPKDYYKTFIQRNNAVSPEDIKKAANKFLDPNKTNIFVVGNRTEIEKLKKFDSDGTISFYDPYGQPTEAIVNKVINGNDVTSVINKYIDAIGGKAAIESITSVDSRGTTNGFGMPTTFEEKIIAPDQYYYGILSGTNELLAYVVNGNNGSIARSGVPSKMPPTLVPIFKSKANLKALTNPKDAKIVYELDKLENVDGQDVYVVNKYIDDGKIKIVQHYDAKTFLLLKDIEEEANGAKTTTIYKDYRDVKGGNGIKMPFQVDSDRDGKKSSAKYESIKVNGKIGSNYFKIK